MGLFAKSKKNAGYLAIGLRADGLCAVHIKRSVSAKPEVELLAFYPGNLQSTEGLLERLSKDVHAVRYQCGTMLAADEYQILTLEAPNVPADELKAAIRWRLKDMLDYHVDDATIDVLDIPPDPNAPTRNHSMYAIAARNGLIENKQALFAKTKVPLSVIDVPEMAQRNLSVLLETPQRGLAMLTFTEEGGLLTVTHGGELYLSRRIDVSLAQLQESDVERRDACFDRITLELQRSLDHFDRQFNFIPLARLVLGPMPEAAAELRDYLASNLYVPVENLKLEDVLDFSKTPDLQKPLVQQKFLLYLGAALREEEKQL
ncbi:MSHA biogenesis protein MshI [Paucimonas lemoignei]|uniref:MSHA biogenesis protein MshI n=1 Tax=Paucimonas lemoignei TaxID=29443 RepID=A0A4V2UJ88_PAULE|nr:agglutinin biogenesis protein MshI [Paucimonas lemoignei]TCS39080.1 MSHA biogenesis protein MshI [Paucimonas lemoignei]